MDLDQARRIVEEPGAAAAAAAELLGDLRRPATADEIRLIMRALRAISSELAALAHGSPIGAATGTLVDVAPKVSS